MKTDLKNKCEKLLGYAKKYGATNSDVILSRGDSFSLTSQNGDIDKYKVSGSQVVGVRVIKDSKVGISYSESMDDESLEFTAKSALENAENSEENLFESEMFNCGDQIFKSEFEKDSSSTQDKIDLCLKLESEVKKRDSRIDVVPYNGYSESNGESYYLNSKGTFSYNSEYYQSCYTSALLKVGDKNGMHYHGSIGRNLKDLDLDSCIDESIVHASQWLEASPLKTGNYDIIFTTDSLSQILGLFSNIFSGKGAMEKNNPFAEKLNTKIAGEALSIMDIPDYENAFFKSYVDSEGLKHKKLSLIKDGVLSSFYHNSVTAKYFGVESTAHASRGAKSSLGVGGTTKVVLAGKDSDSSVKASEYFEVHTLQGLHSGANVVSGDFSFAASGYLCKDGVRNQPVKGVTVSGNFHKLLLDINILGDKIHSTSDNSFFSPLIRFEKMSVAGV